MQTVHVGIAPRPYDVLIGTDILSEVGPSTRSIVGGKKAFIVSNVNVDPLYGKTVTSSLKQNGYETYSMVVGSGEAIKNMRQLAEVLERIAEAELSRDDVVIALGGGVIGDLAGFAASIYMRGCHVVQLPTSLLAMVDSSVGGKTAVDLEHGKNLAGTFFQPAIVIANLNCLQTISPHLFNDSIGEVIKYGVMCDRSLFDDLVRDPLNHQQLDYKRLERIVTRCVEIKRDIVARDEKEAGDRQILNLGHTIGHAIEIESNYKLGHGSCVAEGMCYIARACAKMGRCTNETAKEIIEAASKYGLPNICDIDADVLFKRALVDKKRHGDKINVVMINSIGSVEVQSMELDEFKKLVELGSTTL
jgi:3-dehydroquinate synthase